MIKSYWLRLLLFAVIGAAIGLGISLASPPRYEAILQLKIDQPYGASPPPTSEAASMVSDDYNAGRGRSVSTQVEELTSWQVVRDASAAAAARPEIQAPQNDPEFDPQSVQQSIIVSAEATSDIITLRVRMSKPEYAKAVAQEIYNAFEANNTSNTQTLGNQVVSSLESLKRSLTLQLAGVDAKLEKLRENGAVALEEVVKAEVANVYKLEDAESGLQIELEGSQTRMKQLEAQIARRPKETLSGRGINTNMNIYGFESQIAQHKADRAALLEHYMEDHEAVRTKDLLIAKLESEKNAMLKTYESGKTTVPDPIRQSLVAQLAEERVAFKSNQSRLAAVRQDLAVRQAKQERLPAMMTEYQRVLRDMAAIERRYTDTEAALQGFKGITRARTSPTQVVTAPDAYPEPVSPRHPINVIFGFVGGLILGVLSMLSTEGKRQPIRSLAQLNSLAAQAVYRIIPELRMPFRGLTKAPAEPFETLLVNFRRSDKRPYRLGIVGVTKDSGASITALNVALAAEKHGHRALIVETDPRSTIKRLLGRQGISVEGLLTKVSPNVTLHSIDTLRQVQNPDGTTGFGNEISDLETDITVFDFEPSTDSAEYAFAASHLDEMIVLVRAEKTKSVEFLHAQQALAESGCPIITVVFARSSDMQLVTDNAVSYEQPKALAQ